MQYNIRTLIKIYNPDHLNRELDICKTTTKSGHIEIKPLAANFFVKFYDLKEEREVALRPTQFKASGSNEFVDLKTLDETNDVIFNTVYYKELPLVTGDMDETLIVTYYPKYKAYQRKIRARQIERAEKMIKAPGKIKKGKNQNDPSRFIQKTSVTDDGEIAEKNIYELDTLKSMQMTLLSKESGYIPSYQRTPLTDRLHEISGFRTDYEFISKSTMRSIIRETKEPNSTKVKK